MRIKLIALATVVAALAIGATTANAALQNSVSAQVKFAKAGGPGTINLTLNNIDESVGTPGYGKVTERIKQLIVTSKSVGYNSKALPYCTLPGGQIPSNALNNNNSVQLTPVPGKNNTAAIKKACPEKSLIGKGTFTAVDGTVGSAADCGQAGCIKGAVYAYNYKPAGGDKLGTLAVIQSDTPVPNAWQYMYVGVNSKGTLTANIPSWSELPPIISQYLPQGTITMTSLSLKLTSPKPPKGKKPIFTIKSFKNLDVGGSIVRE
jgi:hypothetical protein